MNPPTTGGYLPNVNLDALDDIPDNMTPEQYVYNLTYKLYDPDLTTQQVKMIRNKLASLMALFKKDNKELFKNMKIQNKIFHLGERNIRERAVKQGKTLAERIKKLQAQRNLAKIKNAVPQFHLRMAFFLVFFNFKCLLRSKWYVFQIRLSVIGIYFFAIQIQAPLEILDL